MTTSELNHNYYLKYKPYPFRLGEFRDKMQEDAFQRPQLLGDSIHAVGLNIIKNHYHKREVVYDTQLQKLIEMVQIRRHNIKHHVYRKKYGNLSYQLKIW